MSRTIEQKVLKNIIDNDLIHPGDNVLVALSGGADSVFLFYFLEKFKQRLKINLGSFHLNHNLRGAESKMDKEFCRKLAKKRNAKFFLSSKNVKLFSKRNGISLEEAGRILRYEELSKCAKKNNFNKIATAHHLDDNSETVLLNLIKGTGLKGLTGIPLKRNNIIRPLLCLSKKEITSYLERKKIDYRTDPSNFENDFQRNYLRNEIIPLIKSKLNPQFDDAISRMSTVVKNLSLIVDKEIANVFDLAVSYEQNGLKVDFTELNKLNKGLHGEFLKNIINKYFSIELEHRNIEDLLKLVNKQPGKQIDLKHKLFAIKERNYLYVINKQSTEKNIFPVQIKPGQIKIVGKRMISIKNADTPSIYFDRSKNLEYISGDKICGSFIIRKWQNGDRFIPLGMKNAKKVSDFLNEQKIEAIRKRENLVLINSGDIVWVVGLRIDDRYKVTEKTKKALKLCLN